MLVMHRSPSATSVGSPIPAPHPASPVPAGLTARPRRRLAVLLLPATLALAPLLAACGSDDGTAVASDATSAASPSPDAAGDGFDAPGDLAACLAEHGVELPAGGGPSGSPAFGGGAPPDGAPGGAPPSLPEGVDAAAMQAAMEACGDLAPGGVPFGGDVSEEDQEALRVYRSCLADNGVEMGAAPGGATPPPTAEDPTDPPGSFPTPDLDDPEVAAAFETCEPLQPEGFGGPPGGAPGAGDDQTSPNPEASS